MRRFRFLMGDVAARSIYHIGCQSWQYDDWVTPAGGQTVFYPRGTRAADMLSVYSQVFDTIEVDSTAYGTPQPTTIAGWKETTPDNFLFSVKVPRAITHEFSLAPGSYPLMDEFVGAAKSFASKLGVVLIQLPAVFEPTRENGQHFRDFVSRLPEGVRYGVEFRHPGWLVEWTFDELNERGLALALVAGKWIEEETVFKAFEKTLTPFAYIRFMGIRDLPRFDRVYRDRTSEMGSWSERIRNLSAREVFVYVDNYFEGHAPATANKLKEMLGLEPLDPSALEPQASLF